MPVCALICALALGGCKIVAKSDDPADAPQDDATRMVARVARDWDGRVLPRIRETAMPAGEVLAAISEDFEAARDRYGTTTGAEGAPSVFAVRGEGTVVAPTSKAARRG